MVLIVLGALVIAFAFIDALWTILWVDGRGGPVTRLHTTVIARVLLKLHAGKHVIILSLIGPIILVTTVFVWCLLVWGGWTLLFSGDARSLMHGQTGEAATWLSRVYVIGSALGTLGVGEFEPVGRGWEVALALAGVSGFFLFGLVVTYVLSLLSAVVQKRSFSSQVMAVGWTAEEFLLNCWDGEAFSRIELQLLSLIEQLNATTERHQAYPLLHYFHSKSQLQSLPRAVALFDEVLTMLSHAVVTEKQPAPSLMQPAQASVRIFLDTGSGAYIDPAEQEPKRPNLARLRDAGIPLSSDADFDDALAVLRQRRRQLLGFVNSDHGEWPSGG